MRGVLTSTWRLRRVRSFTSTCLSHSFTRCQPLTCCQVQALYHHPAHRTTQRRKPAESVIQTLQPTCLATLHSRHMSKRVPEVKPPSKVRLGLLKPYMKMMEGMESWLEKKYPKAHHIYMLFKIGVREFFSDTKTYYRVAIGLRMDKPLSSFTRTELDCYRQIPGDMLKVAPVLLIAALPFMNYVIFPIAYFFPRQLLCRHFWTPQQRVDFGHFYLSHRVVHYPKILQYMEKHAKDIREQGTRDMFTSLMNKLENKQHLSAEEIIRCKPLFEHRPFGLQHLRNIHKLHMWHLSKSLNLSTFTNKMAADALLLHHTDLAILKDGISSLTMEQLQQACFARGLDAKGVSKEELQKYLQNWVQVSSTVTESSLSLLLHCPVLLAYNHPANAKHFVLKDI